MGSTGNKSTSFKELRQRWHNLGVNITMNEAEDGTYHSGMENLTPKQLKELTTTLEKMSTEFPILKDLHVSLSVADGEQSEKLQKEGRGAEYDYSVNSILINPYALNSEAYNKTLHQQWYAGILTSLHPQGTDYTSALSHELTHAIERHLMQSQIKHDGSIVSMEKQIDALMGKIPENIVKQAALNMGNKWENLAGHISHYAASNTKKDTPNYSETMAEAVADYISNGKNANKYSREIVKVLKERLK